MRPSDRATLRLALPEHSVSLPFGPTDFTQVNHRINEVLVRRALRLLDPRADDRVVDFFCGLGNFTLPLARRAARVIGIEGSGALVERAARAAAENGLAGRIRFLRQDLFQFEPDDWSRIADAAGGVDGVLLDPPREGALAVARALAQARNPPRRMVYVSCNPATLARDCAVLHHEAGWTLCAAGVVNMFPHTSHVESTALLRSAGAGS
jgi:23S rRNA (uracil1939-C5)-methyltransferase